MVIFLISLMFVNSTEAQLFDKLKKKAEKVIGTSSTGSFTQEEAAKGIKEALTNGISKGSDLLSKADGFYKNPEVKIPLPAEAKKVESTLKKLGMGKQVDEAVLSLNRAAEDASKSAKDIFVGAIKEMTVTDAINIVKGDTSAATGYLKTKTSSKLTASFTPVIKTSLDKVNATKYWGDLMNAYNKVPGVERVNPDLTAYVTGKAMDALFLMIAKEEGAIRRDPIARTSEILKKVFGKK